MKDITAETYNTAQKDFDKILRQVSKDANILFFPVRLETHFRQNPQRDPDFPKQLCVRIFPDEICLNRQGTMTGRELEDGKFFWMQWYIASGCRKREREAWDVLCDAYPTYRAAWICRELRPKNLHKYREGGELFYRRPYPHMESIERDIIQIYKVLAKLSPTEEFFSSAKDPVHASKETALEKSIREHIFEVKECIYNIDKNIAYSEWIVDYLYDEIVKSIQYIKQRMESLMLIYRTHPELKKSRSMELWDTDFTIISNFIKDIDTFYNNIAGKRISLDELVGMYFTNGKTEDFFQSPLPDIVSDDYGWLPATSNVMPDRFFFIGEADNGEQEMVFASGKDVDHSLELGLSPHTKGENGQDPYWIDKSGNLNVSGGLSWMIDYDIAEKKGMAITVPLKKSVSGFKYIYVLGIRKSPQCRKEVARLLDSQNYLEANIKFVRPGTATNKVEGGLPAIEEDEDDIRRIRMDLEVYDAATARIKEDPDIGIRMNDANILSRALGLDYGITFGKFLNYDQSDWLKTRNAYRILWKHFTRYWDGTGNTDDKELQRMRDNLDFIGDFVANHIRAQGHFPSLQLDNIPYGILPTTDYLKLGEWIDKHADKRIVALYHDLVRLGNTWKLIRNDGRSVVSYQRLQGHDAHEKYLQMARQTPYSITFLLRLMVSSSLFADVKLNEKFQSDILRQLDEQNFPDPLSITGLQWDARSREDIPEFLDNEDLNTVEDLKKKLDELPDTYSDIEKERIVSGFLDIFTFRIDAWFDGLLHYILCEHALRGGKPKERHEYVLDSKNISPIAVELCIGAYGWVFDLHENTRTAVDSLTRAKIEADMKLPAGSNGKPVYRQTGEDRGEYIAAPSLQHAISAAILRSAYLRTRKNGGDAHLCVNLSSTRARQALRMVDGIKSGLSTGLVLGADLERYLHDARNYYGDRYEMDRYIYPLRKLFPQTVDIQSEDSRAADHTMEVINGEALLNTFLERWKYDGTVSGWLQQHGKELDWVKEMTSQKIFVSEDHLQLLYRLVERMYDSYDALNDLLLSESVHRLVLNDEASYYAICDFMAKGKGNLPEPEILKSPMENVIVSHKAVIAMPAKSASDRAAAVNVMGNTEPTLSNWLDSLLGQMNNIFFYVSLNGGGYTTCSLADAGVEPLEYLHLYSNPEQLARYLELCLRVRNIRWDGNMKVELGNPAGETNASTINVYENAWRMDQIKGLLKYARPLTASELGAKVCRNAEDEAFIDLEDLARRYNYALNKVKILSGDINSFLDRVREQARPLRDINIGEIYSLLHRAAAAGLTMALTDYRNDLYLDGIDPVTQPALYDEVKKRQEKLVHHLGNVGKELEGRIRKAAETVSGSGDKPGSECYVDAIKALFGPAFRVITHFKEEYADSAELFRWHDAGTFKNAGDDKMDDWLGDVAEVREGLRCWNNLQMFQISAGGETGNVQIMQYTPSGANRTDKDDWWLGLAVDSEKRLCDVDSLVCYDISRKAGRRSYLVFDAWLEYIPYKKHDAGIVFHCDRPDNEAPQALLLAVHSDYMNPDKGQWSFKNIQEILSSTRFMMMNRAVSPDNLYEAGDEISALFPLLRNGNNQLYVRTAEGNFGSQAPRWLDLRHHTIMDYLVGGALLMTDEDN